MCQIGVTSKTSDVTSTFRSNKRGDFCHDRLAKPDNDPTTPEVNVKSFLTVISPKALIPCKIYIKHSLLP